MIIFEDYGIEIIFRDNNYFMRYDAGWIVEKYDEIQISKEEVERAQRGFERANEIILYYQNKRMGLI